MFKKLILDRLSKTIQLSIVVSRQTTKSYRIHIKTTPNLDFQARQIIIQSGSISRAVNIFTDNAPQLAASDCRNVLARVDICVLI